MKTSIFDMTFVLPPMVEMVKEEKEMYDFCQTGRTARDGCF